MGEDCYVTAFQYVAHRYADWATGNIILNFIKLLMIEWDRTAMLLHWTEI
jgi:hypothetical protein